MNPNEFDKMIPFIKLPSRICFKYGSTRVREATKKWKSENTFCKGSVRELPSP